MSEQMELLPGTLVICTYRIPVRPDWEIWTGPLWVGEIEEPGTDPAQWNGDNSEAFYCEHCNRKRVRWPFGIRHDHTDNLIPVTAEQATLARSSGREKKTLLCSLLLIPAEWSPDTRVRERPMRQVAWKTPLLNGDVQVIYEPDDLSKPLSSLYHAAGQPLPYPYHTGRWSDPRLDHPQNYYLAMWNEGVWCPMKQVFYDFDVRFTIEGFERIEEEAGNTDLLCGLWRKDGIDHRPLFQRGYSVAFLPHPRFLQEMDGCTTREWARGNSAGNDDGWLRDGYVNTGRKHPSCMEPIEKVKWLL